MRCESCGAHNPAEAAWCNQCLRRSRPAEPAPPERIGAEGDEPARAPRKAGTAAAELMTPGFRRRDGAVEWACPRCATYTSLERSVCDGCGAGLHERFAVESPERPSAGVAVLVADAVAPGAGHAMIGRAGPGLARMLLYVVWLGGGVTLLADGGSAAAAMATPLLLGAAVIWVGSILELVLLPREPAVLGTRVLLWLTIGVIGLAGLAGVAAAA